MAIVTQSSFVSVMAGLDPAIQVEMPARRIGMDARIKSGHDSDFVGSM
jgi:hypothetical protein